MATQPQRVRLSNLFRDLATEPERILSKLPDPDLVLRKTGMKRHLLAKLLMDDEIYTASEKRRDAAIITPWRLVPDDREADIAIHEILDNHIDRILRGCWRAVNYGYSVVEIVYQRMPVGIASVNVKPMQWFEPQRDGSLLFVDRQTGKRDVADTSGKFLFTVRNADYENPYGEALLTRVYWPWFFRQNSWPFWMRFLERFSDPFVVGKTADADTFYADMVEQGLTSVFSIGPDDDVKVLGPVLAAEFERVENVLTGRIQKVYHGESMTTELHGTGSRAATQTAEEGSRDDKKWSDIKLIAPQVQLVVDVLWRLMFVAGDPPKFVMEDPTGLQAERAERDERLARTGNIRFTDAYFKSAYGLDADEFEVIDPMQQRSAGAAVSFAQRRFTRDQQYIEDLATTVTRPAPQPIPPQTLRALVESSTNEADLERRLADAMEQYDADLFQEQLERAYFMADVIGYTTANQHIGEPGND